jgi:Tol biopolymer transport system component
MSPEQARGQEIDKRTDIWAFGCVLYEMLCGQPTFEGDTVSDVLARILERQVDLDRLPDDTPSSVVRLLRRCLEKDPTRRLRDIGDARWDLAGEEERPAPAAATVAASRGSWPALIAVFAAGALVGALLWLVGGGSAAPPVAGSMSRFELQIPPSDPYSTLQNVTLALSPDGRALAYAAQPADQAEFSQIYLRPIDSFEPLAVPDTFGAYSPFFSPDGKWIGYFDRTGLWKKPVRGGPSVMLTSVPGMGRGASWAETGRIVYSPSWFSAIHEISADGGEGRAVTTLLENEKSHRFPSVTPDGKVLIFTVSRSDTDDFDDASVAIQSLETGERRTLVDGASCGRFLARDRLLYGRAGRLYVAPLDLDGLELAGPPRPVVDDLLTSPTFGSAQVAVSSNGTLAYLVGSPELFSSRVVEVSRSGETADLPLAPRPFTMVVPSADGKRMAMRIDGANGQVWIHDSERGTLSRITHLWDADFPSWQPGGESISYVLSRGESSALARVASDGTGEPEILWEGRNLTYASWAPDGRSLVFTDSDPSTNGDLWILDLDGEPEVRPYLRTPADEVDAVISPDGNWLAYTSDVSGRAEVYVQGYPVPGRRWQISAQGGLNAIWSVADDEFLFKNGDEILAVPVELGEAFSAGIPHHLFELPNVARGDNTRSFAVSRDGRYFAVLPPADWQPTGKLRLVLDWASTLE